MRAYSLTHLSDSTLLEDLASLVRRDRTTTAALLAHIAEFDTRKLYVPAGFPSMHAYCVEELHLSEDAAAKRIQAGRAARRFPILFGALASGELHLAAIVLLAPHLSDSNIGELVEVARHKSKTEIAESLAGRFPRPELPAIVRSIPAATLQLSSQHAPGHVVISKMLSEQDLKFASVSSVCTDPIFGHCSKTHVSSAKTTPLSADRFALQLTMSRATHDKLRYAQELLSYRVRPGDVAEVLDRALDALIVRLEKQKFAAASTARPRMGPSPNHRHVSAHVKRAVWARDRGRCTFVGDSGHRCNARQLLEFDHTEPVARGGRATVASMRLRCRAHNQYEAERAFGAEFMSAKRAAARQRTADARASGRGESA